MLKFTLDGKILPAQIGEQIGPYRVTAVQPLLDRWAYRAEGPHGPCVIAEGPAYLQPEQQAAHWQAVAPVLEELGMPLLDWFVRSLQGLHLHYAVYPDTVWSAFENPLQDRLWAEGLSEELLCRFYDWMRDIHVRLAERGWCNPSLALPLMGCTSAGSWLALEWEYCVPLDGSLTLTRFLLGYHQAQTLLPEALRARLSLAEQTLWSSCYASLLAVLLGRSARLWSPQAITWGGVRNLLSTPVREWLLSWPSRAALTDWRALPTPCFRPEADVSGYVQACELFRQAWQAAETQDWQRAEQQARAAHLHALGDPWPLWLLARLARQRGERTEALGLLAQALRLEPLVSALRDWVELALEQGDGAAAAGALQIWLQQTPQDDMAWGLQAKLAAERGDWPLAEKSYRQAARLRPRNPLYQQGLHEALSQLGQAPAPAAPAAYQAKKAAFQAPLHETWQLGRAPAPLDLTPGMCWGDWQLLSPLSENAQGRSLWRVQHQGTAEQGLLKAFRADAPGALPSCSQEAALLGRLQHPGLLSLRACLSQNGGSALVYPWYEAPTLAERLRHGPLPPEDWLALVQQLHAVLVYLHAEGLAHGDVAPSNLLWVAQERRWILIDYDHLALTGQSRPLKTQLAYAPPELLQQGCPSAGADAYSLALVLLQAATGIFPDLARHWRQRDFERYRAYLHHLPSVWVEALLAATRWEAGRREALQVAALPVPPARAPLATVSELAGALHAVALCEEASDLPHLLGQLWACERSALSLYHGAFHAWRLGLTDTAESLARACLRADADHVPARWLLAEHALDQRQNERARQWLQQALQIDERAADTYRLLARCHAQSGRTRMAWAACDQLERCLPGFPDAALQRFFVLVALGDTAAAEKRGQELLQAPLPAPARARVVQQLAALSFALSQSSDASGGSRPGSQRA
ncbi:MAG: protein kinase domain-containing protein [Candidatus Sericytochromatia bacterium]